MRKTTSFGKIVRRLRGARAGTAAVEFGLMAPLLLALFVPIADLGAYIYDTMETQLAAQAGVEYAIRNGWDPTAIETAVISAAPQLHLSLVDSNVPSGTDVLPSPFDPANVQSCGCVSGTTMTSEPCSNPLPTCPSTGVTAGVYYKIGAQMRYHTISGLQYPFIADNTLIVAWAESRR